MVFDDIRQRELAAREGTNQASRMFQAYEGMFRDTMGGLAGI